MAELLVRIDARMLDTGIPITRSTGEAYRAWLELAGDILTDAFAGRPLWFIADWERARAWAYPGELESKLGERSIAIDGVTFRLAFSEHCDEALLREYVASGDFRTDAILLAPLGRDAERTILATIRETAGIHRGATESVTANVATSTGDGAGLVWFNHGREAGELRALVERLAAARGFAIATQ